MALFGRRTRQAAPAEPAETASNDQRLEALMKAVVGLGEIVEAQNEWLNRVTINAQTQRTEPVRQATPAFKLPEVNADGLPNPADDLAGFTKGFSERVVAAAQAAASEQIKHQQAQTGAVAQEQSQRQEFLTGLAADFDETYPDLVEHDGVVQAVAEKLKKKLERRGTDLEKYLRVDAEGFFEAVAEEARAELKRTGVLDKPDSDNNAVEGMQMPDDPAVTRGRPKAGTADANAEPDPFRGLVMSEGVAPIATGKAVTDTGSWVGDMMRLQREHRIY